MSLRSPLGVDRRSYRPVPFQQQKIEAALLRIIDGDTLQLGIPFTEFNLSIKLRVSGIDAPETPKVKCPRGKFSHGSEYHAGLLVKKRVIDIFSTRYISWDQFLDSTEDQISSILVPSVEVILFSLDKYSGRYVGDVITPRDGRTLSSRLLSEGLVKCYEGKKKERWDPESLNRILTRPY